jgi:hypothetical protein
VKGGQCWIVKESHARFQVCTEGDRKMVFRFQRHHTWGVCLGVSQNVLEREDK